MFGPWRVRFRERFVADTTLAMLSDKTLFRLSLPGEDSAIPFYEIIMGTLNLGNAGKFHYLTDDQKMLVVEIHLFLADQIRFEMMRRLRWIESFAAQAYPLVDMIRNHKLIKNEVRNNLPKLATSHPDYDDYNQLIDREKEVFIRRLLVKALDAFQKRLSPPSS